MIRLNVGSGDHPARRPWINADAWPDAHPDVVADIRQLPYTTGTVDAVYCGHVLEHLDYDDGVSEALAELGRVLAPDGRLCVVGPDLDRIDRAATPELWEDTRYGARRWPGDAHLWACTAVRLLAAVTAAGFTARTVPITSPLLDEWPVVSRIGWQCAILAAPQPSS